mmetsp:Transcript_19109/g.44976  ORF Transcript_19109/g.44976 Transcript_19109/m.44976 type:complete len:847 (+) Transcript_19109:53-2593(+)
MRLPLHIVAAAVACAALGAPCALQNLSGQCLSERTETLAVQQDGGVSLLAWRTKTSRRVMALSVAVEELVQEATTDDGGSALVTLKHHAGLAEEGGCWCWVSAAQNGWSLSESGQGTCRGGDGPRQFHCQLPPLASEGPYKLQLSGHAWLATPMDIWYSTPLAVSLNRQPYFGQEEAELLVRTNASAANGTLHIVATMANGTLMLLKHAVPSVAHVALPLPLTALPAALDEWARVELMDAAGLLVVRRSVRLVRIAEMRRGATAVDFKRRGLVVDGRPFLPISWFSTYLSFGLEATLASLRDMARHGANSVMIYNLVSRKTVIFEDREPPLPGAVLDAAATLGIKVHVYLLDIVKPLAEGTSSDWERLSLVVRSLRDHPAVMSWYVADDDAGGWLPEVYARIKAEDPYHLVVAAINNPAKAHLEKFRLGADVIMLETYSTSVAGAFDTMERLRRWPTEFMPAVTCGRAWSEGDTGGVADAVISPQMFRAQAYSALAAGATGEMWFAYRNADGWDEPGLPLLDAGGSLARELLDLVPSLLSTGDYDTATAPPQVSSAALVQSGEVARMGALRVRAFREASGCTHLLLVNGLAEPLQALVNFSFGTPGIYDPATQDVEASAPFEKAAPPRRVRVRGGRVAEWLPALGVQLFRFSGKSRCAELQPEQHGNLVQWRLASLGGSKRNLLLNPSFERSAAFVSAPDGWDCSMAPPPEGLADSSCFADTHVVLDGRHSGRFVTGSNPYAFRIRPFYEETFGGAYEGSVWATADSPMELLAVREEPKQVEEEVARISLTAGWKQLFFNLRLSQGAKLTFKVTRPGVVWLDAAELRQAPRGGRALLEPDVPVGVQ